MDPEKKTTSRPQGQQLRMADIARMAGVDTSTVSRALAGSPRVTDETRARIAELVRETGYVVNRSAKTLRDGRANQVLVILADIAASFYPEVVKGIEEVMFANGVGVTLGSTMRDPAREAALGRQLLTGAVDGLLVITGRVPEELRALPDHARRIVALSRAADGADVPWIGIDNRAAMTEAMAHLHGLGHRDILHLGGPASSAVFRGRREGYAEFMAAAGLGGHLRIRDAARFDFAEGAAQMRAILAGDAPRPTAIICANDDLAIGAMSAAREAGLSLPRDLSIVGFDGLALSDLVYPRLTTVRIPRLEIGRRGAQMLLNQLRDGRRAADVTLPHNLDLRESSAAPPAR